MPLLLNIKPFSFHLVKPLITSKRKIYKREGWLIHIESSFGRCGWGEVSPLKSAEFSACQKLLNNIQGKVSRRFLEDGIKIWPSSLAFGIGAALAEIDCIVGEMAKLKWLEPPQSAILLPHKLILETIDTTIKKQETLTFKLKVGRESKKNEQALVKTILQRLPQKARLRLDANESWSREEAMDWANYLRKESRLEWLEQPLPHNDFEGLKELSRKVPIALDESLSSNPSLRKDWKGWQVRRPVLDGDPRSLLQELLEGKQYRVICTSFETGIGRRWVNHLAALQQKGPTPTAPGLAPGWSPNTQLFNINPKRVWEAA